MKIRVKESGNIYDVDAVFVKGGELILPLSGVEIIDTVSGTISEKDIPIVQNGGGIGSILFHEREKPLQKEEPCVEEAESYDYEALRNELAAKLYTMAIKNSRADAASNRAIEDANEFIRQLKKSPVK